MKRKDDVFVWQRYPPIPLDAKSLDVIEEFMSYVADDGKIGRRLIGRVYCPREPIQNSGELFDPLSDEAKAAMSKYSKQIKNIKRYNRDIQRRRLREE